MKIISISAAIRGLGLSSLETEQVVKVIDLVVSLFKSFTPAMYLLRDSIELLQLESGLITLILESNNSKVSSLLTKYWMH